MITARPASLTFHSGRRAGWLALRAVVWMFAALWPIAAIASLAFVFSDPELSQARLFETLGLVAGGSVLGAVIDGWLLTDSSWWTIANL